MVKSLSVLTNNPAEELNKGKCKDCKSCLVYMTASDGLMRSKCLDCCKIYEKRSDENLLKRIQNTYKVCDRGIKNFCLMLWKGVYLS